MKPLLHHIACRALSAIISLAFSFLLLFETSVYAAEVAAFTLKDGSSRQAIFVIMKDDFIFVKTPRPNGTYQNLCFHKTLVSKIVFLNGRELNLAATNSPPQFNDRLHIGIDRLRVESKTITRPADFVTYQEEIAVRTLGHSGIADYEASALTDALRSELAKTGRYKVLEREQMQEILMEQEFQQSDVCDAACAVEIGKILGVRTIALGNVTKIGKMLTINVRLVDVSTSKILMDINEISRGSIENALVQAMPVVAQKISSTYSKKKPIAWYWYPAAGAVVATAIIIPAVVMSNKPEKNVESGGVGVSW